MIYLAAPLFTQAERSFNAVLCDILEGAGHRVFLPQRDVPQYVGEADANRAKRIFNGDLLGLYRAYCVVAVVDGSDVDSGTAWECGFAYAKGVPVIGLRTDFRELAPGERYNLMIEQSATTVNSVPELLSALSKFKRKS